MNFTWSGIWSCEDVKGNIPGRGYLDFIPGPLSPSKYGEAFVSSSFLSFCWSLFVTWPDDNFDEFSAETLAALDNELQQIKLALLQRFPQLDLSSVIPIGQVVSGMAPQRLPTPKNLI